MENTVNSSVRSPFRRIFTAIKNKNVEEISTLIQELEGYVNYKSPDADGRAPLHEAAKLGDEEILKLFVSVFYINVNIKDNHGSTPLHYVIEKNENLEAAKILIQAGADIGKPDNNGESPLHILIEKHVDSKTIKSLINMKKKIGTNPLFEAVGAGNIEIINLLIDYGCDINCVGGYQSLTLLHYAALCNKGESHFEVAKMLLKIGLDVHAQDYKNNTALHYLVEKANIQMIDLFLKNNAKVNIKNEEGKIPLFNAITAGNFEAVQLLIDHRSDISVQDEAGNAPLHLLVCYDQVKIVQFFLNSGANVDVKNKQGQTPLFNAVKSNADNIVQLLLHHGSNINTSDNNGLTPLHLTTTFYKRKSNYRVFELLLKNGANVNAQDNEGKTPLHHLVHDRCDVKNFKLLLCYNPDVNIKDKNGEIPLLEAIRWRNDEAVKLLVDHGSDVNVSDRYKRPALHKTLEYFFDLKAFKYLLKAGADANAPDAEERTPLMNFFTTCMSVENNLQFLLKYSDINITDRRKNNIFFYCMHRENNLKIVLEHIAKLQALDLLKNQNDFGSISFMAYDQVHFVRCSEELTLAKNTKLQNCWVSFINLLLDDRRELKNYAGNANLVADFESSDCLKKFPIYGPYMEKNMRKGLKRRKLFDQSSVVLSNNCLPIFNPSHLIIRDILDCCLSTKDLSKFCE